MSVPSEEITPVPRPGLSDRADPPGERRASSSLVEPDDHRDGLDDDPTGELSALPATSDLGRRSVRAGATMLIAQGLALVVGVGSTVLLAWWLGPEPFGLVAMALTYVALIGVINDFGIPASLINRASLSQSQASTLFWTGFGASLGIALASLMLAPVISHFYGEPKLVAILALMSLIYPAVGVNVVHQGLLRRQMRFAAQQAVELGSTLAGLLAALVLGLGGAGYWALAAQYPVTACCRTVALWSVCRWRPNRPGPWSEVRSSLTFGGELTLFRLINHLGKHLDRVVIGYFSGRTALGLYTLADRWAMFPVLQIYPPLLQVATSGLSRAHEHPDRYRRYFARAYGAVLTVILPCMSYLIVESSTVLGLLLGPRWDGAVPIFRLLLVGAFASGIAQFTKWIYLVESRTRRQLHWGVISAMTTAVAVAAASPFGALTVAGAFGGTTAALAIPAIWYCLRGSTIRPDDVAGAAWRPVVSSVAAGGLLFVCGPSETTSDVIGLLQRAFMTAGLFGLLYGTIWRVLPGGRTATSELIELIAMLRRR